MSYDISFKVKIEGVDAYVEVGECYANTTWNVRDMIVKSTGLEWINCANNGLCKDVIPHIRAGYVKLSRCPKEFRKYEATNGWGTVESTREFFKTILDAWDRFKSWTDQEIVDVTTFWIE